MNNLESLALPAVGLFAGLIMLAIGLLNGAKARSVSGWLRTPVGSLKEREAQMLTGKARAAVAVNSPVTQTPCAFYLETVEEYTSGSRSSGWRIIEHRPYGGFYVDDGTGKVLVLPGAGCLDLLKPEITGASDGVPADTYTRSTRRREHIIAAGEDVTVMGTPVPLGNLMGVLRSGVEYQLPPELMAELLALEKEKGPTAILCLYGPGLNTVADAAYDDYVASAKSSSSTFLQLGAIVTAVALAIILHTLKGSFTPTPADY